MARIKSSREKFDPKKYEEEVLRFWEEGKIYEKLRERLRGGPKFFFLDGPPYPSAEEPHPGTLWNKILKDSVIRFRRSLGFDVLDRPGWDTHGLPIEVMTERRLGLRSKREIEERGIDKFINDCRSLALHNIEKMGDWFREFGVSMRWDDAYLTLKPEYIDSAWWGIKRIWEQGRLKRGLKVVHWCPRCETVLSDYEVNEYRNLKDPSIYVRFQLEGRPGEYILVWTTTPWTIPANVAVMVHPNFTYVRVRVDDSTYLLAEQRLEAVARDVGWQDYEVVERLPGSALEGLRYVHPLRDLIPALRSLERAHFVILSEEFVTLDEGTGCVHSAPGHGREDFEAAHERYGLPVISPVDDRGSYTDEAGPLAGLQVREANDRVIDMLRERGALVASGWIVHKYPVCWRCGTPLIIRATEQWFIRLVDLKEKLISEVKGVRWVPEWAGARRFVNWLEDLEDWVISRQRYWGTPLPIWVCENCGETVAVGGLRELADMAGEVPEDPHRPWVDGVTLRCPKCGGEMRRVEDVLDVWYDSGASFFASLGYPSRRDEFDRWSPVDFIVEGHDQIRGWFFSLLRLGVLLFGKAPYRSVLMHGFMLDERGQEMHKSKGNYEPPSRIVERAGRDAFRIFVLSKVQWNDIRFVWRELENVVRKMGIIWNVYSFAGLYLSDLDLPDSPEGELDYSDRWLLSRFGSLRRRFHSAMESLSVHEAVNSLLNFYLEDLSHGYLTFVRRDLRRGEEAVRRRRGSVLLYVLLNSLPMLAVIAPIMAEKIYLSFFSSEDMPKSVNFLDFPDESVESWIDEGLEADMATAMEVARAAAAARASAGIKRRQPLRELVVVSADPRVRSSLERFSDILTLEANVRSVRMAEGPPEGDGWISSGFDRGEVYLYSVLGPEEVREGLAREVIRRIQQTRKEMGLTVGVEKVEVRIETDDETWDLLSGSLDRVAEETDSAVVYRGGPDEGFSGRVWDVDGRSIGIWLRRL